MPYTVSSSEKLRKSGSDAETKAMLYLMNFHEDRDDVFYFVVDFFNDITGMNRTSRELWDVQSKGSKQSGPKAIGKELVTLYKNYISEFDFKTYILFLGGVTQSLRIDDEKNVFDISNVKDVAKKKIKDGLKEECESKTYIRTDCIVDKKINDFLNKVRFVIDDKDPSDYVRPIVGGHPKLVPADDILNGVFNEIRDNQASKKNITVVEGISIDNAGDALSYCRHLTKSELKLFVLQRVLNWDFLGRGIPRDFMDVYAKFPDEKKTAQVEECQAACCRALFNNNCADGYWNFFEFVYDEIINDNKKSITHIYNDIPNEILNACPDLDTLAFKYFIAVIMGGVA